MSLPYKLFKVYVIKSYRSPIRLLFLASLSQCIKSFELLLRPGNDSHTHTITQLSPTWRERVTRTTG